MAHLCVSNMKGTYYFKKHRRKSGIARKDLENSVNVSKSVLAPFM